MCRPLTIQKTDRRTILLLTGGEGGGGKAFAQKKKKEIVHREMEGNACKLLKENSHKDLSHQNKFRQKIVKKKNLSPLTPHQKFNAPFPKRKTERSEKTSLKCINFLL